MPPLTPSATFMLVLLFRLRFLGGVVVIAVRNSELHEAIKNFFLRDLRRFVTRLFDHRHAAGLNLASAQRRKNHKTIFAVDIVGDRDQAEPPKEAMISSMRPCCR